jgi:hypothetical protein
VICTGRKLNIDGHEQMAYILPFVGMKVRRMLDGKDYVVFKVEQATNVMVLDPVGGGDRIWTDHYHYAHWLADAAPLHAQGEESK